MKKIANWLLAIAFLLLIIPIVVMIIDAEYLGGFFKVTYSQVLGVSIAILVSFYLVQYKTDKRTERKAFEELVLRVLGLYDEFERDTRSYCCAWKEVLSIDKCDSQRQLALSRSRTFRNYLVILMSTKISEEHSDDFNQVHDQYMACREAIDKLGNGTSDGNIGDVDKALEALKNRIFALTVGVALPKKK